MANHSPDDRGRAWGANDPLLRDVLGSPTEEAREAAIAELLAKHVYERVDRILGGRFRRCGLGSDQQEDVRAEILLKLVSRLRRLVDDPDAVPVSQFLDYVAVVTFNGFDDFLRHAHPLRTRLKNRILYALRHDERFALWDHGNALLCGFASWRGRAGVFLVDATAMSIRAGTDLRTTLNDLFAQAGAPLELEWVVSRIAESQRPGREVTQELHEESATTDAKGSRELENLQSLRQLWSEIGELPPGQRVALLLHARDAGGDSVLRLLPMTGIATIRQIAERLLLEPSALAELWRALPLDDNRIAAMLRITRQQVINLRRSARDRLKRRLQRPEPKRRSQ